MIDLFSQNQDLYWREPLWLIIALYPCIIIIFKIILSNRNSIRYADFKLQPWIVLPANLNLTQVLFGRNTLYLAAWILFAVALSGPRISIHQPDEESTLTSNIMIIVDTSLSMQATDISPNRLRRAKIEIYELLEKAKNHRIGITVFSARPHLYVPLTSDYNALHSYLDSLDKLQLPTSGSDPVAAIQLAIKELGKFRDKSAILLITDGDSEIFSDIDNFSVLSALNAEDIPLFILGVGSIEGSAIPLSDGTWLMHNQQPVISRMNEPLLEKLANQYNGVYSPVRDDNSDWNTLYDNGMARQKNSITAGKNEQVVWDELYGRFLFPSIILFMLSLTPVRLNIIKNNHLAIFIIISFSVIPERNASAFNIISTDEQKAYSAYHDNNFKIAAELYKNIKGYNGHMGLAASLYKTGDYHASIQPFTLAILAANTERQRKDALYNLANSYLHTGQFTLAITLYQDALRYQPDHKESLYNLQLSRTLQDTLIKKQNEEAQRIAPRQGQGPSSARLADNTEINTNTSVSLGESENKTVENIPIPDLPGIEADTIKSLLKNGLKNIHLVEQENFTRSHKQSEFSQDINAVQLYLNEINDEQPSLWKRLFEIEEGFPAPVDKPRTIPGEKPW